MVLAARGAELLDLELLRHRALVLRRHVVGARAVPTGHLDDVTHDLAPAGSPGRNVGGRNLVTANAVVKHGLIVVLVGQGARAPVEVVAASAATLTLAAARLL